MTTPDTLPDTPRRTWSIMDPGPTPDTLTLPARPALDPDGDRGGRWIAPGTPPPVPACAVAVLVTLTGRTRRPVSTSPLTAYAALTGQGVAA